MPQLRETSSYQGTQIRLQFDETFITCAPAVLGANSAYGKAMIAFKLESPYRLAIAAAAAKEPEDVSEGSETLALRELATLFLETVITGWEGPGQEDPHAWLTEHPDDFEALVVYCQDLEVFRRGARDGDA